MPELFTPEGAAVPLNSPAPAAPQKTPEEINRDFSRAMASEDPSAVQSPPLREPRPEGEKRPRGRPRKSPEEKPRTEPVPPASQKSDKDFTDECAGLSTLAWAATAAVPWTSPYACVIEANQEDLVKALNSGCQQNPKIREAVERWSSGAGGVYMLQLASVGANMGVQVVQLLKDPELRAEARAHTEGKFREFLKANGVKVVPGTVEPAQPKQPAETPDVPAAA